jgi:hypothetical protein
LTSNPDDDPGFLFFRCSFFFSVRWSFLSQHIDAYVCQTPSAITQPFGRGMAEVDKTLVMGVHFIVDPYDNGFVIAQVCHPDPGMHRQRIAGPCQLLLAEYLICVRLSALELIGVVTGDPVLHFDGGRFVMVFGQDTVPDGSFLLAKDGYGKDEAGK